MQVKGGIDFLVGYETGYAHGAKYHLKLTFF
jgi:hypothetical protein